MFWRITLSAILVISFFGSAFTDETAIHLAVAPPTLRIRAQEAIPDTMPVVATVAGARGETESFQLIVRAAGGKLEGVHVSYTALENEAGNSIPADAVTLFREVFVPVRHSVRRAAEPPGLVPDPLVPFVNPYTGDPIPVPRWDGSQRVGPRFGADRFEVWPGQNQPLWVDIALPYGTPAGVYRGSIAVRADGVAEVSVPVELTVWGFDLPKGPTHENHFGGFERVATYLGVDPDSEAFHTVEDRFAAMMAGHRLNPPLPRRLRPKAGDDGAIQVSDEQAKQIVDFVNRFHITNIDVPRAPFGDPAGADRDKAARYYQSWYAFLERLGWTDGAYIYLLDEPNDKEAYDRVRQLAAAVDEAEPRLRCLVVEQPYTNNPDWGVLDGAVDIWCPLFGFVDEESIDRVRAQGDDVWSYTALVQTAPDYHPRYEEVRGDLPPFWQIDFPVTSYRIAPWLNRRYNITGLLYWSSVYWDSPPRNPWDDPGFRISYNGEGSLFYPGNEAGIDGPVASIRLKNLRDGMEDYEYFQILEDLGGGAEVEAIVRQAVPTWGTWLQAPDALPRLRQQLAEAIIARMATSE